MWIQIRSLIWVVCQRVFLNFSVDQKKMSFVVIVVIRVKFSLFFFPQKRASTAGFSSADNYGFDRDDVSIWVNTQDFCTYDIIIWDTICRSNPKFAYVKRSYWSYLCWCNRPEFPPSQFFPKNRPAHSFPTQSVFPPP